MHYHSIDKSNIFASDWINYCHCRGHAALYYANMNADDERRLQREADIAKAKRGPDYSRLEGEISNAKTEQAEKAEAGRVLDAVQARIAANKRAMDQSVWIPPAREPDRDRGDDTDR